MSVVQEITVETAQGCFTVTQVGKAIVALTWGAAGREHPTPLLQEAACQLADYFAGRRRDFDLPLAPRGSAFQQQVWRALRAIPFGQVKTYGALARELGGAAQPVGAACGANPIPVFIPCHRVIAAGGQLGGFSGGKGAATKRQLLKHEGAQGVQGELF